MDATRVCLLALDLFSSPGWSANEEIRRLYALSNSTSKHYRTIVLSKRNGGERQILAPDYLLKTVQRNILKNVLVHFPVSPFAMAYRPGSTVVHNARPHLHQPQILKLDIESFFENISWLQVWRVFRQTTLPNAVVTMLTHLCCYRDALPQGAATSPAISNLVMLSFDERMGRWCQERRIVYTRYCDDMTFSGEFSARQVRNKAAALLAELGLRLNKRKTAHIPAHKQQTVTGIVVNEKLQLAREQRRLLRQEVHFCRKFGVESHLRRRGLPPESALRYLQSLQGKMAWLLQVNPDDCVFRQALRDVQQMTRQIALPESC
ncbi:reverse transcriptase domain-containing protein [Pseudocitrobacter cyperus]|uniref:RNA-directed DNA polymerase n=1 Tax=Pseudocitrobacter cyperus TaxID=3112843 RepID=A0ABV0HM99_9ENTR